MCGIAGYINFKDNFIKNKEKNKNITESMINALYHRDISETGIWIGDYISFGRLHRAFEDDENNQPMEKVVAGYQFVIVFNGELYNGEELKNELSAYGYNFISKSDTEILLYSYIHYGALCSEKLNGVFSFCIWDSMRQRAFLCRDRFGTKPLFYSIKEDKIIFASEQKAILKYPGIKPEVSVDGLRDVFSFSKSRGSGVFDGIYELRPGRYMICSRDGIRIKKYFSLGGKTHVHNYDEAAENVKYLVEDSVKRRIECDVPMSVILNDDISSDIICSIGKENITSAYSIYNNEECDSFKNYTYLVCSNTERIENLYDCVHAADLPVNGDTSVLYFCRQIRKKHKTVIDGKYKCNANNFENADCILLDEVSKTLNVKDYALKKHRQTINEMIIGDENSAYTKEKKLKEWLGINYYTSFLENVGRLSMASNIEVRFPFSDHRLIEYVYGISPKIKDNVLRDVGRYFVKTDFYAQRKYNPKNQYYEKMLKERVLDLISNRNEPILSLCDFSKIINVCTKDFYDDKIKILEFILQANEWFKHYRVKIV